MSRYGDDGTYWKESAKMLATTIHLASFRKKSPTSKRSESGR
ncbi:Trehalose-6-phosphate hydrolase [Geobacillus stearothermophilus]|uniref:Trehalose-6-phosphate hydrolase n=1 Tax=Geobacillus stearothermophilus TaxID=1422 RepID=A0A150MSI4_GEOSE|nr:Trehalose-6-phosphate hydrolase [Geobacillus stearothermophilus]